MAPSSPASWLVCPLVSYHDKSTKTRKQALYSEIVAVRVFFATPVASISAQIVLWSRGRVHDCQNNNLTAQVLVVVYNRLYYY
jgi:hypothetical protein